MNDDLERILRKVGQLCLSKKRISTKEANNQSFNHLDIVTNIDLIANQLITNEIKSIFPKSKIISEENTNDIIDLQDSWVIDPIDGSMNLYKGLPFYSTAICRFIDGTPREGAIYMPAMDEYFYVKRGTGVFLNGEQISVSSEDNLDKSLVLVSGYSSFRKISSQKKLLKILDIVDNIRIHSSSIYDACLVAAGKAESRIYTNAKIWDTGIISLIIEESGGKVTTWKGSSEFFKSGKIIISNGIIHEKIKNILI